MTNSDKPETLGPAFSLEQAFEAPPALVFAAFTEPARLGRWWGPKGVRLVAQEMDLRPGGLYHYCMAAGAFQIWGRFVWREITPPEQLVFVSGFSDKDGGLTRNPMSAGWPMEALTTITFTSTETGTLLGLSSQPLNASAAEQAIFAANHASMRQGWSGSLDGLATYLADAASATDS